MSNLSVSTDRASDRRGRRRLVPELPDHGVEPVGPALRRLGTLDHAVLWSSLNVGLLGLVTGSLLVPALGLASALATIVLGTCAGALVLGAVARLGARDGVPGMVLLRGPLGVRGSALPSLLNVLQLLGFTVFEVVVIAQAARSAAGGPTALWIVLATVATTALVLGGPLAVVRRVLRAVAVPLFVLGGAWLTFWTLGRVDLAAASDGRGGLGFWQGFDLILAVMLSWAPLVADYARFGRSPRGAAVGTALGSLVAAWFFALGALLVLAGGADPSVGLTPAAGVLALGALALAEVDKPFADLYSTVVSIQNVRPRWSAPLLAVLLGVLVGAIALLVSLASFGAFLLLIGSCFVPLAGVLLGHAARTRAPLAAVARADGSGRSLELRGFVPWLVGFLVYQLVAPTDLAAWRRPLEAVTELVGLPLAPATLSGLGASLPSFAVAGVLAFALARRP